MTETYHIIDINNTEMRVEDISCITVDGKLVTLHLRNGVSFGAKLDETQLKELRTLWRSLIDPDQRVFKVETTV